MILARTRAEVREWVAAQRREGQRTALVPTMGSLHEGHLSLVGIGAACGPVCLSIFVNPLQFGPNEDFSRYPRDLEGDLELARSAGVSLVFAPSVEEMYPGGEPWVSIVPDRGADVLCGRSRPGHFRGVLTVVAKLLNICTPDVAVFGRKDYQQLTLIRRMVSDLDMAINVVAGPIVREPDGLAMSSRNRYLSASDRQSALALVRALDRCERLFEGGERDPELFRQLLGNSVDPGVSVEYGEVMDPETLESTSRVAQGTLCAIAARVGATRLIDNHLLGSGSPLASI
ncbi:MAG: pantoate--beta-alanine ligase [Gemmatimonadota bacterium]|jgi:pantoate--beta-alanine ligase|nr:pantoate--beta-alanine ligase [Gemmatimonadota bacterium]